MCGGTKIYFAGLAVVCDLCVGKITCPVRGLFISFVGESSTCRIVLIITAII